GERHRDGGGSDMAIPARESRGPRARRRGHGGHCPRRVRPRHAVVEGCASQPTLRPRVACRCGRRAAHLRSLPPAPRPAGVAGAPPASPPAAAAGAFAGPPVGAAPPVVSPTGYQSPYYTPSGVAAPVHRTPWMLIIAGILALTVLMAGLGTALAVIGNRNSPGGSGIGSPLTSPAPGVTPTPVASPTSKPGATTTESNDGLTVPVPPGWSVASKDGETIILMDPNTEGDVTLASGPSSPAQSAQDNKTSIDGYFKGKYPDTRNCPNTSTTNTTFNGAKGISWTMCFTLTSGS